MGKYRSKGSRTAKNIACIALAASLVCNQIGAAPGRAESPYAFQPQHHGQPPLPADGHFTEDPSPDYAGIQLKVPIVSQLWGPGYSDILPTSRDGASSRGQPNG